jgi:hypothetical protein
MQNTRRTIAARRQGIRRRAVRCWMPVIDPWIGSDDHRLWRHQDGYDFDWSSIDPWTRRITQS